MFNKYTKIATGAQKRIFLGSPEAEAEAASSARVPLLEVYEDYHGLSDALSAEKFMVIGRKGSGKSAFGSYIHTTSLNEPNLHCKFIKKSDINLEKIIQIGQDAGAAIEAESFFKWIIYTSILGLFSKMETIENKKEYDDLRKFLEKNRGYIDVSELETTQLISRHGFDISIDYLKRFVTTKLNKQIETKSERASYFKILPHLEELLIKLLSSYDCVSNENFFSIFFDDLDVDFRVTDFKSMENLMALIRACRHINNDIFSKNNLAAKVVLFIRDDIERHILHSEGYADSAKIFSSYAIKIDWYEEKYAGRPDQEDEIALKKFINRRIKYVLEKIGAKFDPEDPWNSLVGSDSRYATSSFKHVVNQTLFRPRDLLLFFLPLEKERKHIPLDYKTLKGLEELYSAELAKEIRNELSAKYSADEIESIFKTLGQMLSEKNSQEKTLAIVRSNIPSKNPWEVIKDLFETSLIGTVNVKGWYYFKCRESEATKGRLSIEPEDELVVQYGIRPYLQLNKYNQV